MDYAKPEFSAQQVNTAGRRLATFDGTPEELADAIAVIENWRASHAYPLQAFYVTLKRRACKINQHALTAQRTKRLSSIALKLNLQKDMKLSQMQDIGGCRAVLSTVQQVRELEHVYTTSEWAHKASATKDYIAFPKETGYRGIHLRYRFSGKGNKSPYENLKIEVQLRTYLQHTWATAVEAAQIFTKQALKSNRGTTGWLRFFALMGSVFAIREGCPLVPGTPTNIEELFSEIRQLDKNHKIVSVFAGYREIIPHIQNKSNAQYFLVTLDPMKLEVNIRGFKKGQSKEANKEYMDAEKVLPKDSLTNVVLVSVSTIATLKRAYPNYFLDTQEFLREITAITNPQTA